MTSATTGDIRGVLISIGGQRLLLPNATVAEIISYRDAEHAAAEGSPAWLLGDITWRQRKVPLLSLERLFGDGSDEYTYLRGRIVVCYSLLGDSERPYLGIISDGIPRLVRVGEEDIEPLPLGEAEAGMPLLARLKLKGEEAIIPDIARLSADVAA
jgi:chemosensory pili system protein ChpC